MGKSLHPDRREFNLSYLIEERYNRWEKYEEDMLSWNWSLPTHVSEFINKHISLEGKTVAEIGIGSGLLSKQHGGSDWDGYDISWRMCELSKPYYKSVKILDIVKKPLPQKYDFIILCGVFGEGLIDATVIDNIKDSLNEGGQILTTFPCFKNYMNRSGWNDQNKLEEVLRSEPYYTWDDPQDPNPKYNEILLWDPKGE